MIFAVERNDMQQYRSGHNEHDWKSCVRQKRTESSNLSCCAKAKSLGITGKTSDTKAFFLLLYQLYSITCGYTALYERTCGQALPPVPLPS